MDRLFLASHTWLALSPLLLQEIILRNSHFCSLNSCWFLSFWAIPGLFVTILGWIGPIIPSRRGVICVMLPVLCLLVRLCLVLCCRMRLWTCLTCLRKEVFSKSRAASLPPHRPYDCAIDLVPGTSPPKGRLYSLSAPEREAMEKYISDSLAAGLIHPSSSPAGAGFFLWERRMVPCDLALITEGWTTSR